jgi:GH25 family lysozyme M1 (1,4-beta-N-acetylmuramidase)
MIDPTWAKGIDVSHWKPVQDWETLAGAGLSFIGAKATQGLYKVDSALRAHRNGFRQQPFVQVFYYHYGTNANAAKEAEHLIDTIGPLRDNERLVLDNEGSNPRPVGWLTDFFTVLLKANPDRPPMLYGSERIWQLIGNPDWPLAKNVRLMLARYNDQGLEPVVPKPWATLGRSWDFWQFTDGGQTGPAYSCPGVGACDASYFNGNALALATYTKLCPLVA